MKAADRETRICDKNVHSLTTHGPKQRSSRSEHSERIERIVLVSFRIRWIHVLHDIAALIVKY